MKIYRITVLIFLLLMPTSLLADMDPLYPMKAQLRGADKIILGRITDYSPVAGYLNGIFRVCGWAINVEVDHAFRGDDEKMTIFTDEFDNFIGVDQRYFMLIFKNQSYNKTGNNRYSKCDYKYWGMMGQPDEYKGDVDISDFEYSTRLSSRNFISSLYPIDPYLTKKVGGDWLMSKNILDSLSTHFVEAEENPDHPEPYVGVYLFDFLKENWDTISAPQVVQK